MSSLKGELEQAGQGVALIDQGIKFRAMAEVALRLGQTLDSPLSLDDFISSPKANSATLTVLEEVAGMDDASKKERLYTPELSMASGKVGKVPNAHRLAVGLLRSQVIAAAEAKTDIILIDGRSMEEYARRFTAQGLAKFVMGWYFKCDPTVAARRSLGIFDKCENLTNESKLRLWDEASRISDRNQSDTLRDTDPLREPMRAYNVDLPNYGSPGSDVPSKMIYDILGLGGLAVVDTTYTNSIPEMTKPVTELTKLGLLLRGPLERKHVGIEVLSVS